MSGRRPTRITLPMYYLMLTLVDGPRHGYAMGREVEERSDGSVRLGPASLYWTINRLAEAGFLGEVDASPADSTADGRAARRRYYALTDEGRATLERETANWSKVLAFARSKSLAEEEE